VSEGYTDDQGVFHPFTRKSSKPVAGAAVAVVLAAVAGGGTAGSAAAASGAADEFSAPRTSQSQEANEFSLKPRNPRGGPEIRVKGDDDSIRASIRLRHLGRHPVTLDSRNGFDCRPLSDGEIHQYFLKHQCVSINRTLMEIREKDYAIRFSIATIEMPDSKTAEALHDLFLKDGAGGIIPLRSESGKYHHVPFLTARSSTTLQDSTVINIRTQGMGRTPGAEAVASLATSVLFGLD
jgi:hypothetical protein